MEAIGAVPPQMTEMNLRMRNEWLRTLCVYLKMEFELFDVFGDMENNSHQTVQFPPCRFDEHVRFENEIENLDGINDIDIDFGMGKKRRLSLGAVVVLRLGSGSCDLI